MNQSTEPRNPALEPLSPAELAAITARADAATPGPWHTDDWEIYQGAEYVAGAEWIGETCRGTSSPEQDRANAAFVAAARTDVPALLADNARLRAEREALRREVSERRTAAAYWQGRAAEERTETLRQAADLAHEEGDRLYDDTGLKAAEAAWRVSDMLRALAAAGQAPAPQPEPEPDADEVAHVVADDSDDPEHVDDCPGCETVLRDQVRAVVRKSDRTQVQIAGQLGVSQKHLSQMLTGRAVLTLEWAERIATACGHHVTVTVAPTTPDAEPGTPDDDLRQAIALALARADRTGALGTPEDRAHEYLAEADAVLAVRDDALTTAQRGRDTAEQRITAALATADRLAAEVTADPQDPDCDTAYLQALTDMRKVLAPAQDGDQP